VLGPKEIMELFRESKVMREGHYRLASGKHSKIYFQSSQVLQYPDFTEKLCEELARRFKGREIDVIAAPAGGGILVAYEVAKKLGVRSVFAERENGKLTLKRGFNIEEDEQVLVVGNAISTGATIRELLTVLQERGAIIVGVGALVDRSGGKVQFGVKTEALLIPEIETWEPEACPLCRAGVPFSKTGN